jgi:hypothetical protein
MFETKEEHDKLESTYREIFESVSNKKNWKEPTRSLIYETREKAEFGLRALTYFCGGAELFHDTRDNVYNVSSRGYYYYIGA